MPTSERYELLEELGRGAMGVVYRARDRVLEREVAVKMLRVDGEAKPHLLARMMREARAIATLEHPNIVRIHDVLDDGLVMEYVRGRPLELGALSLADRLKALEEVAGAIHAAHERGIVHRDLKPGNVLREESGRVVVMDFGLAHLAEAGSRLTRSGTVVGTPLYMAPEQIRGERVDGRADVYSLGVMLYEALAGRVPFVAPTVAELYAKVLTKEPPPLKGVPRELVTICFRTLAKDVRDRYRTAGALAEDLASHRAGRRIGARPISTWMRLGRRKGVVSVVAGVIVLAVLAAGAVVKLHRTREGITEAQGVLLEEMRRTSEVCLEAALDLRRVGKVDRMGEYAAKVYGICDRVIGEMPGLAEPHYVRGRMHRAMMEDAEALEEQERALRKEPGCAPALYERVILVARLYVGRVKDLMGRERQHEGQRLAEEGGGEVRPGSGWTLRSEEDLAQADLEARKLMRGMEEDLEKLKAGAEALSEGQRACAEGLWAWVTYRCEESRRILQDVVQKDPYLEEAYEVLATHEEEHENYQEATRWWTEGLRRDRGYVVYLEGRGLARTMWGRSKEDRGEDPAVLYEAAIEDYGEALRLNPGRDKTWVGRGVARMNCGMSKADRGQDSAGLFGMAIEDFGEALRLNPRRDETWIRRGLARSNWGSYKVDWGEDPSELYGGAIEDYGEAFRLNAGRDDAWIGRGMAHMWWGEYKEGRGEDPCGLYEAAIEELGEALKLDPARAMTWMIRGQVRARRCMYKMRCGEDCDALYEEAIEDFAEALKLNAFRDETWWSRGVARRGWGVCKAGRGEDPSALYEAAMEDFEEALKLNARRGETWADCGIARLNWGDYKVGRGEDPSSLYKAAIEDFGEALRLNAGRDKVWACCGTARLNWGLYKSRQGEDPGPLYGAAIEDFEKALAINRSRAETWRDLGVAHGNWGFCLVSRGRAAVDHYRSALEAFREALRVNPSLEAGLRPMMEECRRWIESAGGE